MTDTNTFLLREGLNYIRMIVILVRKAG